MLGDCSTNLSNSALQDCKNSEPFEVLSFTGKLSSTLIFLENLEYARLAALWPSRSSLTRKN